MAGWRDFQEALVWYEEDHVLMKRQLRPFCLDYQFWLEAVDSPLLTGGEISLMDLEVASRICTSDYGQGKYVNINIEKDLQRQPWRKLKWALSVIRTDVDAEMEAFHTYIQDYSSSPETIYDKQQKDGKVYHSFPPAMSVASILMEGNFEGGNREAIWTCPLGEAYWYSTAFLRNRGEDVKLLTEHDREFMEQLPAYMAAKKDKKKGSDDT